MFDQAGMLREAVKWDYELRTPDQIVDLVARAYEVAMSNPRGPVYLSLPREPSASPTTILPELIDPRNIPSRPHPDPQVMETLALWIADAQNPLIITSSSGSEGMPVLARVAERYAIPVVTQRQLVVCLPQVIPCM